MATDSLVYSLIQALHNLGGAVALGAPVAWLVLRPPEKNARALVAVLVGVWTLQGVSGAGFGAASWYFYGSLPDLHPIAVAALVIKIGCMAGGATLSVYLLVRRNGRPGPRAWLGLAALAALALTGAAVLRWNA